MRRAFSMVVAACLVCQPGTAEVAPEPLIRQAEGGQGRAWLEESLPGSPVPWTAESGTAESGKDVTDASLFATRQVTLRVLGELYLRAREDQHRRSPETWEACAALARQLGCDRDFCRVLAGLARGDIPARQRAELRVELGRLSRGLAIDELALRQWVELLPLPSKRIREAMDALPMGNLFWLNPAEPQAAPSPQEAVPGTSHLTEELLGVMDAQAAALSSVRDKASADASAAGLLPQLLRYWALRVSLQKRGMTWACLEASPEQQRRFASLSETLRREWVRLREAGFYDSADLVILEGLVAVS